MTERLDLISLVPIAIIWFGSLLIFAYCRLPNREPVKKLRLRLWAYKQMKSDCRFQTAPINQGQLDAIEFEILLGILKKVEAKNGTLVSVWAFLLAALIALFAEASGNAKTLVFVLIVSALPFIVFAMNGTRQIDNFSAPLDHARTTNRGLWKEMMHELMLDAVRKEELFFLSKTGAYLLLFVMPVLLWLQLS